MKEFKHGKITLLNCDCMEYMAGLEDNAFDLAVVDPPYGSGIMCKNKKQRHRTTDTSYRNKHIPGADYFKELQSKSKERIIWGSQYMAEYISSKGSFIVWDKGADPDLHNMSACDIAWYSKREKIRKVYLHWCGAVKCEKVKTIHIHQKPVKLYDWLYSKYTKPGQRILDTHGGSFSSAIAAHYAGLEFVGCELDTEYYEAAVERFKKETRQIDIFQP